MADRVPNLRERLSAVLHRDVHGSESQTDILVELLELLEQLERRDGDDGV